MKQRLDKVLHLKGLVETRSQAESFIRLGEVYVNNVQISKPGFFVNENDRIELRAAEQYVSRAGLKLASVAKELGLIFKGKTVLDVGSSTGGFTDYALQNGAVKVVAVDVGTNQLHPKLRTDERVALHEQTDIRRVRALGRQPRANSRDGIYIANKPDIVLVDVSFISLREILPHISKLMSRNSQLLAMVKPQFEAERSGLKHKGVIKNEAMRRQILKDFEAWSKQYFFIENKKDSSVSGEKGNTERFYVLKKI